MSDNYNTYNPTLGISFFILSVLGNIAAWLLKHEKELEAIAHLASWLSGTAGFVYFVFMLFKNWKKR